MDYVWTVNGKEVIIIIEDKQMDTYNASYTAQVFNMTQPQITSEIVGSQLKMVIQVERGTFIVPSFDEIWPQAGKEKPGKGSKRMGMDYILEVRRIVPDSCPYVFCPGHAAPWSWPLATA